MTLSVLTSVVVMLSVLCFTGGLLLSRRDKSLSDRLDVYLKELQAQEGEKQTAKPQKAKREKKDGRKK